MSTAVFRRWRVSSLLRRQLGQQFFHGSVQVAGATALLSRGDYLRRQGGSSLSNVPPGGFWGGGAAVMHNIYLPLVSRSY